MLLNWSRAVTVNVNGTPAVAVVGSLTVKCVAAAGLTEILALVLAVIVVETVSLAVIVSRPEVLRTTGLKTNTPAVKVESAGSTARGSLLLRWTMPVYA